MATEETIDHAGKILEREVAYFAPGIPGRAIGKIVESVCADARRYGYAGFSVRYWDCCDGWVTTTGTFEPARQ